MDTMSGWPIFDADARLARSAELDTRGEVYMYTMLGSGNSSPRDVARAQCLQPMDPRGSVHKYNWMSAHHPSKNCVNYCLVQLQADEHNDLPKPVSATATAIFGPHPFSPVKIYRVRAE